MKHSNLLDAAIVAALLLAHVPGLAEELPAVTADASIPIALIAPAAPASADTPENPAERL